VYLEALCAFFDIYNITYKKNKKIKIGNIFFFFFFFLISKIKIGNKSYTIHDTHEYDTKQLITLISLTSVDELSSIKPVAKET
jgi:hypothetical protein